MTYLYITRHGETAWNLEGRFQGQQNSELTEQGFLQAENLGGVLDREKIELIISSPLERAQATARAARGNRKLPIILLDELKELSLGQWEGRKLSELKVLEAEQYHLFWNDPLRYQPNGGESFQDMICRMNDALTKILQLAEGKRALVVTHGMSLMAILHHITGQPFNEIIRQPVLRQTSITKVRVADIKDPVYEVEVIGDTNHLDSLNLNSAPVAVWEGAQNMIETRGEMTARLLIEKELTISTAESLTGGMLASAMIDSELGISASFKEGYITYSNEAKMRDLGVLKETLENFGAVSEETAREMVTGAQAKSHTDIAISTTGIAGPGGDTATKPLGLTYIAIWYCGEITVYREVFQGSRNDVRKAVVNYALDRLISMLKPEV